jgi:hypothetical protein
MWQPSNGLARSDWMLGLRPIDQTGASGQYAEYPFMTLTAQFVLGVYKYVVAGSKGFLLVI